jgi:hypothetical protein
MGAGLLQPGILGAKLLDLQPLGMCRIWIRHSVHAQRLALNHATSASDFRRLAAERLRIASRPDRPS